MKCCDEYVCLFFFLSVCLPVFVVIHYILLVLRMMSYFHTMGQFGRIKHDVMYSRVRHVAVAVGL